MLKCCQDPPKGGTLWDEGENARLGPLGASISCVVRSVRKKKGVITNVLFRKSPKMCRLHSIAQTTPEVVHTLDTIDVGNSIPICCLSNMSVSCFSCQICRTGRNVMSTSYLHRSPRLDSRSRGCSQGCLASSISVQFRANIYWSCDPCDRIMCWTGLTRGQTDG